MMTSQTQKNTRSSEPKLRFMGFDGAWEMKALGEIFKKDQNRNTKNKETTVLTNSAVEGIVNQQDYFDKDIANQDNIANYFIVDIDDFIYNPRISKSASVGPFKRNRLRRGIMSPLYTVLKPKIGDLDFLENYFETRYWHKYMYKIANYGARHDRMSILSGDFMKMPVPFPSIAEQKKIASFIGSIDLWLEISKKEKELLYQYKKGMIQKIFSQEVSFKDKSEKKFPAWSKVKLKEILKEHKTRNTQNIYTEVFSVAKTKGVINQIEHLGRSYSAESLSNYKVVFPGDVIYTKSPTANFPFGIIKQNQTGRSGVVSTLYAVLTPANIYIGKLLHEYFISWVNTYNYLIALVQKGAKNTINIGNSDFLNGAILALPVSELEQKMIVEFLESIDRLIEAKNQQVDSAVRWKRGLLQQLFI